MAKSNVDVLLLQMQLDEQIKRVNILEEEKSQLELQLIKSEEFQQRLVNYLIVTANQQEQLEEELKQLKLRFFAINVKKKENEENVNLALEEINQSLQQLSI